MTKKNTYMLYARVSPKGSDWHAEETSIALQFQQMKNYITAKDPAAVFLEQSDEFKSGKNLNRPGIKAVLEELDRPDCRWGTLVVWALDRLSRSLSDAVPIFERLMEHSTGFICIRQPYLSTDGAMARFTLNQTILIAQLEREMTSERVKAKMSWIAERGKWPAGKVPYGYRRKAGAKNEIEIDPEAAENVKSIFAKYVGQTETVADIRRTFPILSGKNQLYRMLRNRIYLGEIEYDGKVYPGNHPAIIDPELFEAAQRILPGERRAPCPSRQVYKYLLTGLVRCSCGKLMTPYSVKKGENRRYFYYKCQDTLGCKKAVNAERLDTEILNALKKLAVDDDFLKECYEQWKEEKIKENTIRMPNFRKAQEATRAAHDALENIKHMFLSGIVNNENKALFNEKLIQASEAYKQSQRTEQEMRAQITELSPEDTFHTFLKAIKEWGSLLENGLDDYHTCRNLILSIVQTIKIKKNGKAQLSVMTRGTKWRRERDSNSR